MGVLGTVATDLEGARSALCVDGVQDQPLHLAARVFAALGGAGPVSRTVDHGIIDVIKS